MVLHIAVLCDILSFSPPCNHNILIALKAVGIHPILANEREKLESSLTEVISKGCIWSGAKKTSPETAKNRTENFVLVMR